MVKYPYLLVAIVWTGLITYLSLSSFDDIDTGLNLIHIPHLDKIIHATFYLGSTSVWYLCFRSASTNTFFYRKALVIAAFFSLLYGWFMEYLQGSYTIAREGDWKDGIANTIGVVLAVILIINKDIVFRKLKIGK